MSEAVVASKTPNIVPVEENKTYYWCACGLSKSQPFCDGSHSSTDIRPVMYKADASKSIALCGCKQTKKPPFCDGSHSSI
jgi:CDGSH-type Zn-finger protein